MRWKLVATAALALGAAFCLDRSAYDLLHANFNKFLPDMPAELALPKHWEQAFGKCGESLFGILVGAAIWQLAPSRRGHVACLAVASLSTVLAVETVKRCAGRLRPDIARGATQFDGLAHAWDRKADGHSFPSGHTAAAGCYGAVATALAPPLRGIAFVIAAGVGSSRMYEERHFLSDCLAGGLLGWWIGMLFARGRIPAPLWAWCDARFAPQPRQFGPARPI